MYYNSNSVETYWEKVVRNELRGSMKFLRLVSNYSDQKLLHRTNFYLHIDHGPRVMPINAPYIIKDLRNLGSLLS